MEDYFTITNLENFESNPIWKFIIEEARDRRETIRTELESGLTKNAYNVDKKLSYDDIRFLQGEANSLVWILTIVPLLKERAKELIKEDE